LIHKLGARRCGVRFLLAPDPIADANADRIASKRPR
jgi:hypothetical protein